MRDDERRAPQRRRQRPKGARRKWADALASAFPDAALTMYVIVVGGGTVGYYMSRDLLERGHEVTLIEKDSRRADWLETQLGSIVMRGDGCEVKFLSQTGIERADAIVAVTADDEDNLIALQMAKKHFKVKKTIARVNNPTNVEIFKMLGVDDAVSATDVLLGALEPPITT